MYILRENINTSNKSRFDIYNTMYVGFLMRRYIHRKSYLNFKTIMYSIQNTNLNWKTRIRTRTWTRTM